MSIRSLILTFLICLLSSSLSAQFLRADGKEFLDKDNDEVEEGKELTIDEEMLIAKGKIYDDYSDGEKDITSTMGALVDAYTNAGKEHHNAKDYNKAIHSIYKLTDKYAIISVPNEPIWRLLNFIRGKYLFNIIL